MAERIRDAMAPYGFSAPERKGDSYVFVSGRGPVLVDGGFVHRRGNELVKEVLDFVNDRARTPKVGVRSKVDITAMYISDVEYERDRGKTIPKPIADRLIERLRAGVANDPEWKRMWGDHGLRPTIGAPRGGKVFKAPSSTLTGAKLDAQIAAAAAEVARLEAEYNELVRTSPLAVHLPSGERLLKAENAARRRLDRLHARRDRAV